MQLGMMGLGRMGANMVRRLLRGGHHCVVYDANPKAAQGLATEGAVAASSLDDFVGKLTPPRACTAKTSSSMGVTPITSTICAAPSH
jgi:6-phosphogluconate dehydrogenase